MSLMRRMVCFVASDIRINLWSFLLGTLQVTLAILLVGYMVHLGAVSFQSIQKCEELKEKGMMYQIDCIAESGYIDKNINTAEGECNFDSFYNFLDSLEDVEKVSCDSSLNIYFQRCDKEIETLAEVIGEDYASFSTRRVSKNFFDFYNLEISESAKEEFCVYSGCEIVPVVAGCSYKKIYDLGDVFFDFDQRPYKIVGFLKDGEIYAAPFEKSKAFSLNKTFIVPIEAEPLNEGINYITNLVGTYFVTDDENLIQSIIEEADRLELPQLRYRSLEKQLAYTVENLKNEAITMGSVLAIVFVFAATGMVSYMVRFIQKRLREFAIHMLCGAKPLDVMMRIVAQLVLILIIADVFVLLLFDSIFVIAITIALSIIYGLGIIAYPMLVLKENNIVDIIRRN